MNKLITGLFLLIVAIAIAGCTDTKLSHFGALGDSARVTCYSGGVMIADDFSTGKVANAGNSDGYEFRSKTTERLVQFSGDCVVDYGVTAPSGWEPTLPGITIAMNPMIIPVNPD